MRTKIDYDKIYECLNKRSGKIISASGIAHFIGVDRIYGGTMAKLVRDGYLEHMPAKGYYRIII